MSPSDHPRRSDAAGTDATAVGRASGAFDECCGATGAIRPHWRALISSLDRLGRDEPDIRLENSRRLLAENGVTCFVSRNGAGTDKPWQLDLMPLVISAEEWRELERGLIQRARLLNLTLADLYGTQRLVRDGFLPAPLVFANPGYLRACQAIDVPGNVYLQIYAADLARAPNGQWWVLADRTQAPAGLGFALENRSVLSRVLPEAVWAVRPRPVADSLRVRHESLRRLAPQACENPSIVLLTPGPRNEAYFEHAYLARRLGLTLVEGDDLTVRDRRLVIKTLDGLRPADVVLRRVSDAFCDPLELRGDSLLGVPGLVEAARAGRVSIGNALGTGLLESPAFMPFLPGLCQHLLGEDLRLPSLATWWCGQAREQEYVREHWNELVIRPALSLAGTTVNPTELDAERRAGLLDQLRLTPHEFVGQEQIRLSQAPVWVRHHRYSRPFVLRVFVLHNGRDFTVMAGGLARVVNEESLASAAFPLSSLSKDVWILPDGEATGAPIDIVTAPPPALERAPSELPSRTADNFFWLGRYTERLEELVRASGYVLRCLADDSAVATRARLGPLEQALARLGLLPGSNPGSGGRETLEREILLLLFQEDRSPGVRELLRRIHLAAFSVRDRLSADTWRILNGLGPDARRRPGRLPLVQASSMLQALVLDLAAFSGMEMENMTRGHGWVFLDLGRRIERGTFTARLIETVWRSEAARDLLLEPALEIADSVMTHRRRYFSEPRPAGVMEVLALDQANPRSLAFQLASLTAHAATLPTGVNPEGVAVLQGRVHGLATRLQSLEEAALGDDPAEVEGTAKTLGDLAAGLGEFSDLLTQVYFSHVTPQIS